MFVGCCVLSEDKKEMKESKEVDFKDLLKLSNDIRNHSKLSSQKK